MIQWYLCLSKHLWPNPSAPHRRKLTNAKSLCDDKPITLRNYEWLSSNTFNTTPLDWFRKGSKPLQRVYYFIFLGTQWMLAFYYFRAMLWTNPGAFAANESSWGGHSKSPLLSKHFSGLLANPYIYHSYLLPPVLFDCPGKVCHCLTCTFVPDHCLFKRHLAWIWQHMHYKSLGLGHHCWGHTLVKWSLGSFGILLR